MIAIFCMSMMPSRVLGRANILHDLFGIVDGYVLHLDVSSTRNEPNLE